MAKITSLGAAQEVTGSCHLLEAAGARILLDCGLFQGNSDAEEKNLSFAIEPRSIDAVILSHAHIDHSGRIPLLIQQGYQGKVYTHKASADLCRILLKDTAFLHEKETEWANRKRLRQGKEPLQPLYTMADAKAAMYCFKTVSYGEWKKVVPGIRFRLLDAGHILGSAIVEIVVEEHGLEKKLVYSGDLGHCGAPILRDPIRVSKADLVLMETTYGDRLHRPWEQTYEELQTILLQANEDKGNILIPAFAVGRTQELIYLFSRFYDQWQLQRWQIFIDSPMAIEASAVYAKHPNLYDREAAALWVDNQEQRLASRLHLSRTTLQSMAINQIESGAIIIAGSGMCTGGRIKHHFKHNIWRKGCHVIIVGYQGRNTLGRQLVEGAKEIRLWGEPVQVAAHIHTVGGLSAHADQRGLLDWLQGFKHPPGICLVHGEQQVQLEFQQTIRQQLGWDSKILQSGKPLEF